MELQAYLIATLWIIALVLLLSILYFSLRLGIGPTSSGRSARQRLIQLCVDEVIRAGGRSPRSSLRIYELGSGWGGLTLALSSALSELTSQRPLPPHEVIGFELSPAPYLFSKLWLWLRALLFLNQRCPQFIREDGIKALAQARSGDIILCYLCPQQMQRIADHWRERPLQAEITLITLLFSLPNVTPNAIIQVPNLYNDQIYLYRFKPIHTQPSPKDIKADDPALLS